MVRQTARVIILEILAGFGVLVIVAFAALAIRLASGPLSLDFFQQDIERALANNRDGRPVTVETISLEWLTAERRAVVTATDLRVFDGDNQIAAQADRAEILIDTSDLLLGKIRPVGLVLKTGWIGVHQSEDGWSLAGDPIGTRQVINSEVAPIELAELLEVANQSLIDVLAVLRRDATAIPLQQVRFDDVDIVLTQSDIGERARLSQTNGGFERGRAGIEIRVAGFGTGAENAPAAFSAVLRAPAEYNEIIGEIELEDWSLEQATSLLPALVGRVKALPAGLKVSARVDGETGLQQVQFEASAGAGEIIFEEGALQVGKSGLTGEYLPEQDQLNLQLADFQIGPASGDLSVELTGVLDRDKPQQFKLRGGRLQLDLTPRFSDIWQARQINASGSIDFAKRAINLDAASLNVYDAALQASGTIKMLEKINPRDALAEIDLKANVTGPLLPEQFLEFWPVKQAPGARAYVTRIAKAGAITGATAHLTLKRDSLAEGYLADDALVADFTLAGADVRPLNDIPLIRGLRGTGHMTGNSLRIKFEGGRLNDWAIAGGEVHYPRLSPAGADMSVSVHGSGPAQSLLRIVSESRLKLEARTGLNPDNLSGDGEMMLTMTRPAKPNVPLSEYRYTGEGTIVGGGLENALNGLSLTKSDAMVSLTEKGIRVVGTGELAEAATTYDWSFKFGEEGALADLKASSSISPDILNSFGIPARAYLLGAAPVELVAKLEGQRMRTLDAVFDLFETRLDIAELSWVKRKGVPATATVRYSDLGEVPTTIASFDTEGAVFDGTFSMQSDGRLISANIERAFLKDRAELSGTARRTETDGLLFKIEGAFLDLSRLVSEISGFGGEQADSADRFGEVAVEAEIEELVLRSGFSTTKTKLSMDSGKEGVRTLQANGLLPNGAAISAAYDASGLGDPSFLINSGDASFLASVFLGFDSLEGGTLEMSGTFPEEGLPTQVRLLVENGRLKNAPFVTQILSLASFRGLSDTLAGEGVLFTTAELPLLIDGPRFIIAGARASGPALGLTANGVIVPGENQIDIDGVLVPSFGLNSALGGLPVIGDLFVSRQGEGVISLRYGVEGTFDKAQVSVNPLSAVTPGVLRRIFENPEEDQLIPEVDKAESEEEPIPGE